MSYEKPQVISVSAKDVLSALGPARAQQYKEHECAWWQYIGGRCRN